MRTASFVLGAQKARFIRVMLNIAPKFVGIQLGPGLIHNPNTDSECSFIAKITNATFVNSTMAPSFRRNAKKCTEATIITVWSIIKPNSFGISIPALNGKYRRTVSLKWIM